MSAPATPPSPSAGAKEAVHQVTGIARAASLIAAGNVISRVLGLVREIVIAALFGATGQVSAFEVAQRMHYSRGRARKMENVSAAMAMSESRRANQSEVWD